MLKDSQALRKLIKDYGHLRRLDRGDTPQSRGQRLNGLVSEMFVCWGLKSEFNVHGGSGEIDVGLQFGGHRFVLEAKWENAAIATGPIAKLEKRVSQRLVGTVGIFLSMSGYTQEALRDLKQGAQFSILLLTSEHFEAMLAGFIPPLELLNKLMDNAALLGQPLVPLDLLFTPPKSKQPDVNFGQPSQISTLTREMTPGFEAEVVVSNLPYGQHGVAELSNDELLITSRDGIISVNLNLKKYEFFLAIPECCRNVLVTQESKIYVVRSAGVGCVTDGKLSIVAGGFSGNTCFFHGNTQDTWVFSNVFDDAGEEGSSIVSHIGSTLGDQDDREIPYPARNGTNAAVLEENRFLIIGNRGVTIVEPNGRVSTITQELSNPMGLMCISGSKYIVAAGSVDLHVIDIDKCKVDLLAHFHLQPSVSELAKSAQGGGYLFSHYSDSNGRSKGIIVRWRI